MNVLSIDIDYAFSPTISAYDDFVEGSRISLDEQDKIFQQNQLPAPEVNQEKLELLKNVMRSAVAKSSPIVIADHHHQILDFLPTQQQFSIVNFDHHHDIYYPGWHAIDKLDEGNWVYFLKNSDMISYTWIRNSDSENLPAEVGNLPFNVIEKCEVDVASLPRFDIVFCCSSPHWTGAFGRKYLLDVIEVMQ